MTISIIKQQGFTYIELVAVMVLLGIVTVVVAPRFSGGDRFAQYAARDQILSAFRYTQQRAMYDHSGSCYSLLIDANQVSPQRDGVSFSAPVNNLEFSGDYAQISVTALTIFFDGLGNAVTGSCTSGISAANPLTITISSAGAPSIALEVFPSGYARPI